MVEADSNPKSREINKENIGMMIRFPSQDGGSPDAITINKINGDDIVNAVKGCVGEGLSVNAGIVLELLVSLKETPPTVEQMGEILKACIDGTINISKDLRIRYTSDRLSSIGQFRTLQRGLEGPFRIAVNERSNNKRPQGSLGT